MRIKGFQNRDEFEEKMLFLVLLQQYIWLNSNLISIPGVLMQLLFELQFVKPSHHSIYSDGTPNLG
jgi:hypothetical protein